MAFKINGTKVEISSLSPSEEQLAIKWRDEMMLKSAELVKEPDYPYMAAMIEFRQMLRDWTDTSNFPLIRPEIPLTTKGYPTIK